MTEFDAIIIGGGQAGPPLANRLTRAGMTVALIERKWLGGTCVNTGCMPTKTLVASARAAHVVRHAADYGVVVTSEPRVDMARVKARVELVIANARKGVQAWLAGMQGCTVIEGHARFEAPNTVRVGDESLTAPRTFINVGARAAVPDIPGIDRVSVLTNATILGLEQVPEHLVVIGGSYIGLEYAQMYRRFGAAVTLVERGPRLAAREDTEISATIADILRREGVDIRTNAECLQLSPHARGVELSLATGGQRSRIVGSHVLLAVGRRPNTEDLGLETIGVLTDALGHIRVNDKLETNVPGVWALGDCNGRGAFTHTSYNDFEIVAANLLDGAERSLAQRVSGYALYIDPPLGRAGMTEAEARASGRRVLLGVRPMTRVGRAIEKGETQGLMKIVVDADDNRILGAAILGPGGDEAIHGVIDAMSAGLESSALRWAVPIHPTVAELIPTLIVEMKAAEPKPASA
jgi:pyruvate/2-oxoglutarate dehydrogenase complex dihydrolipoamide dehydrogenase (E3) component